MGVFLYSLCSFHIISFASLLDLNQAPGFTLVHDAHSAVFFLFPSLLLLSFLLPDLVI